MNIYEMLNTDKTTLFQMSVSTEQHYRSYPIKKSSGKLRWIDAPDAKLKWIQKAILYNLLYRFKPHECAVGFIKGISVKDGASRHLGSKVVLCVDVQNFFGSLKVDKVYKALYYLLGKMKEKDPFFTWDSEDCTILKDLLTYKGSVPQGAPSSPALANLICRPLDFELKALADRHNLTYTRYADDLTFSYTQKQFNMGTMLSEVELAVSKLGLKLNTKKTRVLRPHRRMCVTGVVINEKLSVPKYVWRNVRAQLHNLVKGGLSITEKEHQILRGKIEWIGLFRPLQKDAFLESLGKLTVKS